jgi:predicted nucleic acid-binding protein
MSELLFDTSVVSLFHPEKLSVPARALYAGYFVGNIAVASFQTVAELRYWAVRNKWGPRARTSLDQLITEFVVIPPDDLLLQAWADVMMQCQSVGRRLETGDAWVAATAVRHRLTLITHDADLVGLPVAGLNVLTHLP